jgi:hypothetical protein
MKMSVKVNDAAVSNAKKLIKDGKIDMDSDWSEAQPSADEENDYLDDHSWGDYGKWYLAVDSDENKETKGRHKFPYGDFKQVHRDGIIAAKQRAAQNDYSDVEKAADDLLDMIDKNNGNK